MSISIENSRYFKELQTGFKAAEEAGKIIDEYAENGFNTEKKDDGSRVTEADLKSQEKIVEIISEEFPEDGFLGEEKGLTPEDEDRVWVIDPVDGTFNFDKGFSHYCVSIALKVDGESVLGIVYSTKSSIESTYIAVRDKGAFRTSSNDLNDIEEISVSSQDRIEDSVFFLSSFDIYSGELEEELSILEKLAKKDAVHRNIGSCALEMCRVAAGEAGFQIVPIVKEWDYAAAKLIIEESGGEVRTRDSRFSDCTEVVSSNGVLQDKIEGIVSDRFQ